ncbi:MAG: LytTR family DNA-binding domain-containing protein [Pseudomonadota bacterium]
MREWRGAIGLWALLSLLAAAAGPFGTLAAMPDWTIRAGYWSGVAALSVALGFGAAVLHRRAEGAVQHLGIAAALTLLITGLIFAANTLLFPGWGTAGNALILLLVVAMIVGLVHIVPLVVPRPEAPAEDTPPAAALLQRLPAGAQGDLVRLEAQDHYTRVVTTKGGTLVLMRLSDAIEAATGADGARVHRSHWVAFGQIAGHQSSRSGAVLRMSDGAEVPVSRTYRPILRERGIIGT